ncbi:MAG: hypothetical protein AAFO79_08490 [Pseudomonadota bacterium]
MINLGQGQHSHLFSVRETELKLAFSAYVIALVAAHAVAPGSLTWVIAFFSLAAMLFTYPLAALRQRTFTLECGISLGLLSMGLAGLVISPLAIIAAIALHGAWDIAKHRGAGEPFFSWYCIGCAAVDFAYAAALTTYYFAVR